MKLLEFMTTRIESIDCDSSAYDAIERMVDRRIRSLVVAFPGEETDYGVITARDVVFKVLTPRRPRLQRLHQGRLCAWIKTESWMMSQTQCKKPMWHGSSFATVVRLSALSL
jgi:hypothetical protein